MGDALRAPAGRSSTEAAARLRHTATIRIAGPSKSFIELTRNIELAKAPPRRFEPTKKGENDVVI
jgi:hypothetical protein